MKLGAGDREIELFKDLTLFSIGYPMGPIELLDYVGLDTTKFILEGTNDLMIAVYEVNYG